MSEQVIDRATLEKKDKGELTTIVNALGGKATSRMKKSDLVDLIIERSGAVVAASDGGGADEAVSEAGAPAAGSQSADTPTASQARATEGAASQRDAAKGGAGHDGAGQRSGGSQGGGSKQSGGGDQQGGGRQQDRPSGPRPDRSDGQRGNAERSEKSSESGAGRQSAQSGGQQANGNGGAAGARGGNGSTQSGNQQGGDQGKGGNQQGGDQGKGGNQQGGDQGKGDDLEGGNRRRRRRGRGRDRDEMIEPVTSEPIEVVGILDLREDGYGFVRVDGLLPSKDDVYVPVKLVRQFGLRRGDLVAGTARPANRNEKNPALAEIASVNGRPADDLGDRSEFDRLTPVFPDSVLRLERADEPGAITPRILDLVAPIGRGQRTLVVAPPASGKTTLIKELARSIEKNHPDVELVVLMIDERPEDVTDMARHLELGDVAASTFDRPADEHCSVAELTLERAKRMVEAGTDVVIIVDGLTHLARAYNLAGPGTGRLLDGGLDAGAIYPTKHFFGAARNLDEGGSLTVIATVTVETGSPMDDAIFGEFEGTANAEIRLDRLLAERDIFPAIDVTKSGTRNLDRLVDAEEKAALDRLRGVLLGLSGEESGPAAAAARMLVDRVAGVATNRDFLNEIA